MTEKMPAEAGEPDRKIIAGPYTRGLKSNFNSAKDMYFEKIALPGFQNSLKLDDTKYARAAKLGLCFHCMREDHDPNHRPKHRVFGFCPECMLEKAIGTEKLVLKAEQEVNKWFGNGQDGIQSI